MTTRPGRPIRWGWGLRPWVVPHPHDEPGRAVAAARELRIDRFRVFYDVDEEAKVVLVKAVGWKDHNTLFIRGEEHPR